MREMANLSADKVRALGMDLATKQDFEELKARIHLMDSCKKDVQTMEDRFKPIEDMYLAFRIRV